MKVEYNTIIHKFDAKGEKTGWTYIEVPADVAQQLKPGNKRSFRIKGQLDGMTIEQLAVIPMGEGDFILPLNGGMRRQLGKGEGATIAVSIEEDTSEKLLDPDLMVCLQDEPEALRFFQSMTRSHQNYYSNWVASAKTEPTKAKRIGHVLEAMLHGWNYSEMMHAIKARK